MVGFFPKRFTTTRALECQEYKYNVVTVHNMCKQLSMPVKPEKEDGPATTILSLGLEQDSMALEVRLLQGKLKSKRTQF